MPYSLQEIKKIKGLVITAWRPNNNFYGKTLEKFLIAVKDKDYIVSY